MKQIKIELGKCDTCGQELSAVVSESDFIDAATEKEKTIIKVRLRCSEDHPGRFRVLRRTEFDAMPAMD